MQKRNLWLAGLVVIALAGCTAPKPSLPAQTGAPAATEAAKPAAAATAAVDLAALPRDVDVQTTAALRDNPNVVILDVREQSEWDAGHIAGAVLIPMNDVAARIAEIPTDKTVIVQCHSGNRSNQVTNYLRGQGMNNVHNMAGGLKAWEAAGLPVEK